MTADLFATTPQPAPKPSKKGDVPRRKAVFNKLKKPWGEPDKRGAYPYEKIHKQLEGMTPRQRDIVTPLILCHGCNMPDTEAIAKMLNKWLSVREFDRGDFTKASM